jgi:hypothetical protein
VLHIAMCTNNLCGKRDVCYRYSGECNNPTYVEFVHICKAPEHLWYYPMENQLAKKEEK